MLFALVAGSPEPNCGHQNQIVVLQPWLCGSVDLTANEINIMKKKLDLISVVLYCFRVPCICQAAFKGGKKPATATCC